MNENETPWGAAAIAFALPLLMIGVGIFTAQWGAVLGLVIITGPSCGVVIFVLCSHDEVFRKLESQKDKVRTLEGLLEPTAQEQPKPASESGFIDEPEVERRRVAGLIATAAKEAPEPPKPTEPKPQPKPEPLPSLGDLEMTFVSPAEDVKPAAEGSTQYYKRGGITPDPRKLIAAHSVPPGVSKAIKQSGFDLVTCSDPGVSAEYLFETSEKERRVLLGSDSDFLILHNQGVPHAGLVYFKSGTKASDIIAAVRDVWAKGGAR